MPSITPHRQRDAEKRAILQAHPFFGKLSPSHIDRLTSCIVAKSIRHDTMIFAKGDPGSSMFAICEGTVQIAVPTVEGREAILARFGKGDIFGEMALLDGHPRNADAVALTDCELFVIERRDFLPLLREEPDMALRLIEILCSRVRRTTTLAESVMFLKLPGRLAKALLQLSQSKEDARKRKVTITQKELANVVGVSREQTNKQLAIWERKKWVIRGFGEVVILSTEALERMAEGDEG